MEAAIRANQPTDESAHEAAEALSGLTAFLRAHPTPSRHVRLCSDDNGGEETTIAVPSEAMRLFVDILAQMAEGHAVTVVPVHAEVTTQQAADYLNVSRPFVVKLLEEHELPFRMVGNRRRIRFEDLAELKRRDDARRKEVLDALSDEGQKLSLGY